MKISSHPSDHRFENSEWANVPFSLFEQNYLLGEEALDNATSHLPGATIADERTFKFAAHQWFDMFSPSNNPWVNPEILKATWTEGGLNLVRGFQHYLEDLANPAGSTKPATQFVPGKDVAVTPGKVVFRNELIELIQYAPATESVHAEPVLIVPAWIMKYYILDLSPHNSLIRYLTEQGQTVFCISWRNPGAEMRDLPFDAWRSEGFMAALRAIQAICGDQKVHACGYCLGGTLLAIAAAAMARDQDDRLASVTLLAAQTDFTEPGEIEVLISDAQVAAIEELMADKGYLDGQQMGGAFALLRSRDLIWGRMIKRYWLGEAEQPNDLMAWNGDTTRMPARMHSEYLRSMFLRNDLAEGRYLVDGAPIALGDISVSLFMVSTETDHVAPWHSVYKMTRLSTAELTFVLTSGGHNAGIVSEPGHARRHFRIGKRAIDAVDQSAEAWLSSAQPVDGSWWPTWTAWLAERSTGQNAKPPPLGAPDEGYPVLEDAPGQYVMTR